MSYTVCPNCGQNALPVATRCPKCGVAFEAQFIRHAPPRPRRAPVGLILAGTVLTILAGNALWQRFGVAPPAAPFVRKPAPVPAVATPAVAREHPAPESVAADSETLVPKPERKESIPAASPSVAEAPAPSHPAPAPAPVASPPVSIASEAPTAAHRGARTLYSSTWLNLRADRRNSAPVLRILKPGEVVHVDSLSQGWYRVVSNAEQPGWVDRRLLDSLPPE